MKKKILILIIISLFFFSPIAFAQEAQIGQDVNDLSTRLRENLNQQKELQQKINDAQREAKTLRSQISVMDNQIKLTTLRIEETQTLIEQLKGDITDLSLKVERLQTSIDRLTSVSNKRLRTIHKEGFVKTFELFLEPLGLNRAILAYKYIQIIRAQDLKLFNSMKTNQDNYNNEKKLLEVKKREEEVLKIRLEGEVATLDRQKRDKESLLAITKNNEATFQGLINQLKADAESIERALRSLGAPIGPVKKGQVIGFEGNTGCSSGPHLHFEVFENAKVEAGAVLGTRVNPHKYLDNASLGPPMQGYPENTQITTEYLSGPAQGYPLGTHTGLDIIDDGSAGTPILAAADGIAYPTGDQGCTVPGFNNGPAKGVVIDHQNGLVTLYWHLK